MDALYVLQVIGVIVGILVGATTLISLWTPRGKAFWRAMKSRWFAFKASRAGKIECVSCLRKFEPEWKNEGIIFVDEYVICPHCGARNDRMEVDEDEEEEE